MDIKTEQLVTEMLNDTNIIHSSWYSALLMVCKELGLTEMQKIDIGLEKSRPVYNGPGSLMQDFHRSKIFMESRAVFDQFQVFGNHEDQIKLARWDPVTEDIAFDLAKETMAECRRVLLVFKTEVNACGDHLMKSLQKAYKQRSLGVEVIIVPIIDSYDKYKECLK